MYDFEIIETRGDFRAKVMYDLSPTPPYFCGSSPILGIDRWRASQITETTDYVIDPAILEAVEYFRGSRELFERYLRIFHGTTSVEWWHSGEALYVTFDTADWRREMGIDDEALAGIEARGETVADMSEWKAYVKGETYGVAVERLVAVESSTFDTSGNLVAHDVEPGWVEVDDSACWGCYGFEWAEEVAREALECWAEPSPS